MKDDQFQQTDFNDPDEFGSHSLSPSNIIGLFCKYPHLSTRNACLEALKKAMGSKGRFDSPNVKETFSRFEAAVEGLLTGPVFQSWHGTRAQWAQRKWYESAIETLMDAYFVVANNDYRSSYDCMHPIMFTFRISKLPQKSLSPTKALKHVLYYSSRWAEKGLKYARSLDGLDGLEDFLHGYLERFSDELAKGSLSSELWEPIKKILEFMVAQEYYEKKLFADVTKIREVLRNKRATIKFSGTREELNALLLHDPALSACDYLLHVAQPNQS